MAGEKETPATAPKSKADEPKPATVSHLPLPADTASKLQREVDQIKATMQPSKGRGTLATAGLVILGLAFLGLVIIPGTIWVVRSMRAAPAASPSQENSADG